MLTVRAMTILALFGWRMVLAQGSQYQDPRGRGEPDRALHGSQTAAVDAVEWEWSSQACADGLGYRRRKGQPGPYVCEDGTHTLSMQRRRGPSPRDR